MEPLGQGQRDSGHPEWRRMVKPQGLVSLLQLQSRSWALREAKKAGRGHNCHSPHWPLMSVLFLQLLG